MAVTERKGRIGNYTTSSGGNFFSAPVETGGSYFGTLLDFQDVKFGDKLYKGTYNPAQGGGSNNAVSTDQTLLQDAKVGLGNSGALSLGAAQNLANNNKGNPFFTEFFNYYLGIAQERQANLSKSIGRKDMLSGASAASQLGGTLI